jgi:hypothetical protein
MDELINLLIHFLVALQIAIWSTISVPPSDCHLSIKRLYASFQWKGWGYALHFKKNLIVIWDQINIAVGITSSSWMLVRLFWLRLNDVRNISVSKQIDRLSVKSWTCFIKLPSAKAMANNYLEEEHCLTSGWCARNASTALRLSRAL